MFFGIGVGPLCGSFLITLTGGNALVPFYVSLGLHAAYLLLAGLVMPESLEKSRRENAKIRYAEEKVKEKERRAKKHEGWIATAGQLAVRPLGFLKPIALLLPRVPPGAVKVGEDGEVDAEDEEGRTNIEWGAGIEDYAHPEDVWRRKGEDGAAVHRDWTLTKIACGWFSYMLIVVRASSVLSHSCLLLSHQHQC
jgi:hypothetical protein